MRFFILIACLFLPLPAYAQAGEPLIVTAQETLEWDRSGRVFTARGAAVAQQGSAALRGETLVARYSKGQSGQEISKIEASGGVLFSDQGSSVTGESGFYDIDSGYAEVIGNNLKLVNGKDVVTARNRMTYNALSRELKAHGDAVAWRGDDRLRGNVLTARFKADGRGGMALHQIEANGDVQIQTPTETITGNRALYDAKTNIATMTGNVVIQQGQNRLSGAKGQVNLNTNISTLFADKHDGAVGGSTGRVKGVFFPK